MLNSNEENAGKMMTYKLTEGQLNGPSTAPVVEESLKGLWAKLPEAYTEFLKMHDGGEGFIGDNYVVFWKADDLARFNREYEVEKYAPGIFLFASDGGGEGYGFDTENAAMPIVRIPFVGMERQYAIFFAHDLTDLFAQLAGQNE